MNISNLRDQSDFEPKQEDSGNQSKTIPKPNFTTSSWSRLKDPRIVRVSRAFGGKDRHSKVCTVRGLRDRRVRLSVPTAIQLYDLQDRLGLNQPSKVVDWLLNAAKHEIDELPPLQMPPGSNFGQGLQAILGDPSHLSEKMEGISRENQERDEEEERNKHDNHGTFVQSSNFFGRQSHSSVPGLFNNVVPNGSFLKWDPSNLSLSQFGSYEPTVPHQQDDSNTVHNYSMNPSGSHLFLYPPPPQTQSYFPNSHDHNSTDFDPKQLNFQMLSSPSTSQNPLSSTSNFTPPLYTINQGMRPFQLSMNPKFFSSHEANGNEPNK